MRIEETFRVPNSVESVWNFISDPQKIASCLPSVQSIQVIDDRHYEAVVKQSVGFISATFKIRTEILEKQPPFRMVLANKGKTISGADGTLKSVDTITLNSLSGQWAEVSVVSEVTLGGQLAILGAKLIEAKSKELFAEATANLKEKLGAVSPATEGRRCGFLARLRSVLSSLKGFFSRKGMAKSER